MNKKKSLTFSSSILLIVMILSFPACEFVRPPKLPILWIVGLDVTNSIPKKTFKSLRDSMIANVVLSRIRRKDEVHILPISGNPENNVEVFSVGGGRATGVQKEVDGIQQYLQTSFPSPDLKWGKTNIGALLAYAQRIGNQVKDRHRVVVCVFTDGRATGEQFQVEGKWEANTELWFWGVDRNMINSLSKWLDTTMKVKPGNFQIVRISDWKTYKRTFGDKVKRKQKT